jgi:DNA invertase Pin-like site-specific DNA recombinase
VRFGPLEPRAAITGSDSFARRAASALSFRRCSIWPDEVSGTRATRGGLARLLEDLDAARAAVFQRAARNGRSAGGKP